MAKYLGKFVGVGGKVQYPLMALESGLAPLADLSNTTALLNNCIVPGSGPTTAKRYYNGRLVGCFPEAFDRPSWTLQDRELSGWRISADVRKCLMEQLHSFKQRLVRAHQQPYVQSSPG